MSIFRGAKNISIIGGNFTAVSTTVANGGPQNDIVGLLYSQSATAGLLDAKERFDAPECDEGTRTSMILGMKKFIQGGKADSSPAMYWLHGPAGVGKSALAQSLALLSKKEGDHAASFFFSRTSTGRNNGNRLIVTLAYQLAVNFPALQRFMSKVILTNPAILSARNLELMKSLIIDPINKWQKKYNRSIQRWTDKITNAKPHPRLILVDGLDECNDPNVQTDLICCIASAVRELCIPLRFVITSRPEAHILVAFELNLDGVTVTKKNLGDDEDADEQITTFLLKEFAEIRRVHPVRNFLPQQWPHPNQIAQLVSKSSKGFIYPTTVIRYIKMPRSRPDECLQRILGLSEIPMFDNPYEPLDLLYRHIFASVAEANKTSIYNIFHFLVLPGTWDGVTDPTTIERHFEYPPGHVQHVLHDLLCLVSFTLDGRIKVLHASLPDFLLDKSRSGSLYIDVSDAHTTVAASYILSICHSNTIPLRNGFANFLGHMLEANMSNTLLNHRILLIDLLPQYIAICMRRKTSRLELKDYPHDHDIEGIALMIAYLLVLVIRCGPRNYISNQIASMKAYILGIYTWTASAHVLHAEVIPPMTPYFRQWKSTVYHECINHIFKSEVPPSQNETREAIFELHVLMMVPFYHHFITPQTILVHVSEEGDPCPDPERWIKGDPNYWANIVSGRDSAWFSSLASQ